MPMCGFPMPLEGMSFLRAGRLFSRVLLRQYSMNACDRRGLP